jgi:hypothetical protein
LLSISKSGTLLNRLQTVSNNGAQNEAVKPDIERSGVLCRQGMTNLNFGGN